jgi:hypothetical protein
MLPGSKLRALLMNFIIREGENECERCKKGKGDPFISEYYKNKKYRISLNNKNEEKESEAIGS